MNINDTLDEREKSHGSYAEHAEITQALKWQMRQSKGWIKLDAEQMESLDMFAHKIGRILAGNPNFVDTWRDIAGYSTLICNSLMKKNGASDVRLVKRSVSNGEMVDEGK